jgi:outer membrane protein OmpA-like peptidoglycan-associated protein
LFTCLPANSNYALNVSKDGYLFHSENFSLNQEGAQQAMELNILLQPIKKGNSVILQNIFFDTNKFTLKDESQVELKKLLNFLINNPEIEIEIEGHTDNVGSEEYNDLLSMNRSKQVMDYLVENGIDDSRLSNQGFGSSQPIATNDTEEGRSKNRRTAFRIK